MGSEPRIYVSVLVTQVFFNGDLSMRMHQEEEMVLYDDFTYLRRNKMVCRYRFISHFVGFTSAMVNTVNIPGTEQQRTHMGGPAGTRSRRRRRRPAVLGWRKLNKRRGALSVHRHNIVLISRQPRNEIGQGEKNGLVIRYN